MQNTKYGDGKSIQDRTYSVQQLTPIYSFPNDIDSFTYNEINRKYVPLSCRSKSAYRTTCYFQPLFFFSFFNPTHLHIRILVPIVTKRGYHRITAPPSALNGSYRKRSLTYAIDPDVHDRAPKRVPAPATLRRPDADAPA